MKYAIIENNRVINVAKSDQPLAANWIASETAKKGDTYDPESGTFTTPARAIAIPSQITPRQARLQLLASGLLDQVDAAIAAIEDPVAKAEVQIEWEYSATIDREHIWVGALGSALGLDSAALDVLFIAASER